MNTFLIELLRATGSICHFQGSVQPSSWNFKKQTFQRGFYYYSYVLLLIVFDVATSLQKYHQKLEMFFQIIFLIKYLRRSLSLLELQAYTDSFTEFCRTSNLILKSIYLVEQLLVAAFERRESKHMYQIRKRDSLSLDFEKLLTYVNSGRHQIFLLNILGKYHSDQKHY